MITGQKRKERPEQEEHDHDHDELSCELYRTLVRAIAKSAARKKVWPMGFGHYSIKNAYTTKITAGFGSYNQLLTPITLIEITTGLKWCEEESDKNKEIERDVAVLREYYLQAWYLGYIRSNIEECDKQINGPLDEKGRKMGEPWYIQSMKDSYEKDYDEAKTKYFDVFVKNNPRLQQLLF